MEINQNRIGIDLGGTKIEGLLINHSGHQVARHRIPTPKGDYQRTIAAIATLVSQLDKHVTSHAPASVGICIPGALSRETGLVKNANSVCLIGEPLAADLENILQRKIRLDNDANCFTLSEATDGAAEGKAVVFGVIIGTGTGGGIAFNATSVMGKNAITGEWGHNPLPWPTTEEVDNAPLCYCGKSGCIETYLSGPGLVRDHFHHAHETLTAEQIANRSEQNDKSCLQTMDRYEDRLARSLATVINILDPDAIVLGGGLSNISRLYDSLPKRLEQYVFSDFCQTPVLKNKHGDSSGVRGAAWLWP